jgi:VWFA-related protein
MRLTRAVLAASIALTTAGAQQQPAPSSQSAFRSRITIVPVDVRVVDANGKPISDFTVLENGAPQTITHFSSEPLVAEPPAPGESVRELPLRKSPALGLAHQNRRVFLIQLGRGRMRGPSKELPGLLSFLRTRLLPQDYAAVMAWNRATDFTTDHAKLVALVERYRQHADGVESKLDAHFSGLAAVYGSKEIPSHIQSLIDNVFAEASALRPREIKPGQITDSTRVGNDIRQTADELVRAEGVANRPEGSALLPDPTAMATAERVDMTFDEYVSRQAELMQDVGNLYAGIDYMRHLDGEKHLVFVTPKGLLLPRLEDDRNIASVASDARVAIDIIYTGGMPGAPAPRFGPRGMTAPPPVASASTMFNQTFNMQGLRFISELTGGHASIYRYADEAFERIDQGTRHQYLIGYAPSDGVIDGRRRTIAIKVNRPGAVVLYRRSYFATNQIVPLDRRQFVTQQRLTSAGKYTGTIKDIEVTVVSAAFAADTSEVLIEVNVKSPRTTFKEADGIRTAAIDIGVYCGDPRERIVCDVNNTVDLKLGQEPYERFLKNGLMYRARIRATTEPRFVKVIAYDYAADVLGTATKKLK